MFEKSVDELKELGADITTAEIAQQPDLWEDTFQIYADNKAAIEKFLAEANAMAEGRTSVVFAGAGTSDYVGDTVATPRPTTSSRSPRPTSSPRRATSSAPTSRPSWSPSRVPATAPSRLQPSTLPAST